MADGMGGHAAGEVASREAVTAFDKTFVDYPSASIPAKLGAALQQANAELSKLIKANPSLNGMGCTLLGAHVSRAGLYWISVGDSLLLLFRNGKIVRLNADHSMTPVIEESVRQGKLTKQEAETHPSRNALRSAVMGDDLSLIDLPEKPFELLKGDVLLISSDGLLTLSDSQIADCVKKNSLAGADVIASALIKAVDQKKKPKQDNTTVQVIVVPNYIGVSQGFSVKGYIIALFIALIFGCIGAYAYLVPTSAITKLWSALFDSEVKSVPVPVSVQPVTPSAPELTSPAVSAIPSAPGLGGSSMQKADPDSGNKSKNEKRDKTTPKSVVTKPRGEADLKPKPKDDKPSSGEGDGAPPVNGKTSPEAPESFKEDALRKLFPPPNQPPAISAPDSGGTKSSNI
jgi:serine/threonine protein phosphatase PrpC